jgi:NCAIR mutase (PurE)-related protein
MLPVMDLNELKRLLDAYKTGELETRDAVERIKNLHFEDIGFARVDHSRAVRQGFPEVVFGGGKTRAQIVGIVERLAQRSPNIIVTRTDEGTFGEIRNVVTDAEWHESARLVRIRRDKTNQGVGSIAVVTAGTSDIPVAEEAALTAETMGNTVDRIWDAGVAGIHRVLSERSRGRNGRRLALGRRRFSRSAGRGCANQHRLWSIFWWCRSAARYVELLRLERDSRQYRQWVWRRFCR